MRAGQPISEVDNWAVVACDGGGSALGHPKVYINLDKESKMVMSGNYDLHFKPAPSPVWLIPAL